MDARQHQAACAVESLQGCRDQLARYKVPRFLHSVELMQRSPSGKPDYGWATKLLTDAAGVLA